MFLQAVEQEFSEEELTEFEHRDKNKENNVMEWVAKVISEPMQVQQPIRGQQILVRAAAF